MHLQPHTALPLAVTGGTLCCACRRGAAKKWKQSIRLLERDDLGAPCHNTTALGDWLFQNNLEIRANMLNVANLATPSPAAGGGIIEMQAQAHSMVPCTFAGINVHAVAAAAAAAVATVPAWETEGQGSQVMSGGVCGGMFTGGALKSHINLKCGGFPG